MGILSALLGYGLVKSACKGATAWGHKQYYKSEKEIQDKYRCDGHHDTRFSCMITPFNPRYVEYIKELNEFRASNGQAPIMSIEKAESERKRYLEIFHDKVDSFGYILDSFGRRQN